MQLYSTRIGSGYVYVYGGRSTLAYAAMFFVFDIRPPPPQTHQPWWFGMGIILIIGVTGWVALVASPHHGITPQDMLFYGKEAADLSPSIWHLPRHL